MKIVYGILARDSVGKLFAAGLMPRPILAGIYIAYVLIRCRLNTALGPAAPEKERLTTKEKLISLRHLISPGILVATAPGSIIVGVTSPSEAFAVCAAGALLIAAIHGRLSDFAILFITILIYGPIVRDLGFDSTWFAVLFILSMQSAYLTPPFS